MSRSSRSFSYFSAVLSCALACCPLTSWARGGDAQPYPIQGKVLSNSAKGAHSYQVETDSKIYLLMCEKVKGFHMGLPDCKVDDKPIAAGDTVQLRVDGDWAYIPAGKGAEDGLRILTTELKVIPPLPPPTTDASGKSPNPVSERGMVIGTGMHIAGQRVGWSTAAPSSFSQPGIAMATAGSPVMATGPVMAVPVTGGAPVMVMPTGPTGGGIVTGVPVTGGAPITGIATGPVMGAPIGGVPHAGGGTPMGGGGPIWVHLLRVVSGGKIYQLECSTKPCEVDKKNLELGDTIVIRTEKKSAYLSSAAGNGAKEQKFKILGETDDETAAETAPDTK